jgi:hypothetical protein
MRLAVSVPLIAVAVLLMPSTAAAAPETCPSTFTVLHDDRIGSFQVPAGHYQLTTLESSRLSCAAAADAFRRFLEDWDGRLPAPWRLDAATSTFTASGGAGFRIARVGAPSGGGGGRHPATGVLCPGVFRVQHDDWIGSFDLPRGEYTVVLLSVGPLSCDRAMRLFATFLTDFDGRLPRPWLLDPVTGTFLRGSHWVGFRIEEAVTPLPGPTPSVRGRRCPGTFRVLHNDRIGALRLPAGRYRITRTGTRAPSCAASSRALARFLEIPSGRLPRPWRLNAAAGAFTRSSGGGFRVKAVR